MVELLGPLEGIVDLISAATGKDITGWLKGGMKGEPEAMGWWDRAWVVAAAAVTLAVGAIALIPKLKKILEKIEAIVERAAGAVAKAGGRCTGGAGMCFLAGTLILLASGEAVPIETVESGSDVLCELPAATPGVAGWEQVHVVGETSVRLYEGAIVTLRVEQAGKSAQVSGTPNHPFWCVDRHAWIKMGDLEVGAVLDGVRGDIKVVGREVAFARVPVFNFEVDTLHSYRVTELGVLVHNYPKPTPGSGKWRDAEGLDGALDRSDTLRNARRSEEGRRRIESDAKTEQRVKNELRRAAERGGVDDDG